MLGEKKTTTNLNLVNDLGYRWLSVRALGEIYFEKVKDLIGFNYLILKI